MNAIKLIRRIPPRTAPTIAPMTAIERPLPVGCVGGLEDGAGVELSFETEVVAIVDDVVAVVVLVAAVDDESTALVEELVNATVKLTKSSVGG